MCFFGKKGLYLIGCARWGKDTVADILKDTLGLRIESSSHVAMRAFIYDALKDKYGYTSLEECYADRVNHRAEWFDMIKAYNNPDLTALTRLIFKTNDVYVGIRNVEELTASVQAGLVYATIWVDASKRLPREDSSSITVSERDADIIIDNNGNYDQLKMNVLKAINRYSLHAPGGVI